MKFAEDETYEFVGIRFHGETPKAIQCEIGGESFWVPKSQILRHVIQPGQRAFQSLVVKFWWADKSGALEAYEENPSDNPDEDRPPQEQPPAEPPAVIARFMTDLNEFWQAVKRDVEGLREAQGWRRAPEFMQAAAVYKRLALKYHPDRKWD